MEILRYTAFTTDPEGGNRAGVVLDATGASDAEMLAVAAEVGFSETAFLLPRSDSGAREFGIRFFSPLAEVPFCGHAIIATAVAYAERHGVGELILHAKPGRVPVTTARDAAGDVVATLTSITPHVELLDDD